MQFVVQLKSNLSGSCVCTDTFLFCNKTKIDDTKQAKQHRGYITSVFFVTLLGEGFFIVYL